ncbi:MAG: ABC transporter ATP-binding protein [Treponema sp.]|nr:ABC transporter ATP-binding protein [Treponema sp.]
MHDILGKLSDINLTYDKKNYILKNLNLEIYKGELLSLLGPSGCGKTTTLRIIAGLIQPDSGTFTLEEKDITDVPVHKRDFGLVFQSYALFPHMSVYNNIAFGLKMKKIDSATIDSKVKNMAEICGISEYLNRFPKQLSGGQRQRVALARALVTEPKLLLLDEPLSNLDAQLRIQMRTSIKRIQQQLGITMVFVTHDQEECFSISDRVAVMDKGIIVQCSTPEEIYNKPASEMVARFVGFKNFFTADQAAQLGITLPEGYKQICIRPNDIELSDDSSIKGTVEVRTYLGTGYQYEIHVGQAVMTVSSTKEPAYNVGQSAGLVFKSNKIVYLNR